MKFIETDLSYNLHKFAYFVSFLFVIGAVVLAVKLAISSIENIFLCILTGIILIVNTIMYFTLSYIATVGIKDMRCCKKLSERKSYIVKIFPYITVVTLLYFYFLFSSLGYKLYFG